MAVKTWLGITSDWGTASNWNPSGVPITNDEVQIIDGSMDIDGYDASAVELLRLAIGGNYSGRIGSPTSYLIVGATEVSIQTGPGGQDMYIDAGGTYQFGRVRVDSKAAHNHQSIYVDAGAISVGSMSVVRGNVVALQGLFVETYMAWTGIGEMPQLAVADAQLTNLYGEESYVGQTTGNCTIANLHHTRGTFTANQSAIMTNMHVRGGTVVDESSATTALVVQSGDSRFLANGNLRGKTYDVFRKLGGRSIANLNNGLGNILTPLVYVESGLPPLLYNPV